MRGRRREREKKGRGESKGVRNGSKEGVQVV